MDFINSQKKKDDWAPYDNRDEEAEDDNDHFVDMHKSHNDQPKANNHHDIDKPKSYTGNDIDEIDENVYYLGQKKS